MKKVEPTTAAVLIVAIIATAAVLLFGPPDVRAELLASIGAGATTLAAALPRLVRDTGE